ncbi:metal ABC transporter ATP-binding protein [Chroococcidiopsis sp.]|uniref:metal ABC transporter ATP-binding protein n=1 Tax=Chroococcidiopsis sp. TaxID=3088168 RepID=UPI003F40DCFE
MNYLKVTSNKYPILKVENLTVYQGNYLAVRDVSFELISGTDTAIVGPNGAGKSTLVQALLGTIPRAAGKVEIFDRPLEHLGRLCHQIGYMPQNFIFDRSFPISVSELVGLGYVDGRGVRSQRDEGKKAAIDRALKRVDGYHLRRQPIGSLSGGELKRVLLAYCLVMPRQLLILDEAFAGVDAQGAADFYTLLNELKQQENWTVLQISHDLDMVNRHCDRVLCLNQSLICTGTPEIALSPQNLLATYGPNYSRYHHRH